MTAPILYNYDLDENCYRVRLVASCLGVALTLHGIDMYPGREHLGAAMRALAAREVDMTVNNPIEAEKLWREGAVRPLCVFDGKPLESVARGGLARRRG